MHNAMDNRIEIANQVIDLFRAQPEVKEVALRGSLSEGRGDEYSDIDITIDVSGHDNGRYMLDAVGLMYQDFDVLFHDFNCGTMPEGHYIVNFYLRSAQGFVQVDLDVIAEPHCLSLSIDEVRAMRGHVTHLLKLWVVNFKLLARGDKAIHRHIVAVLPGRVGGGGWDGLAAWEVMGLMLERISERADGRYSEFIAHCRKAYERELSNAGC